MIKEIYKVQEQVGKLNHLISSHENTISRIRTKINTIKKEIRELKERGAELTSGISATQKELDEIYWRTDLPIKVIARTLRMTGTEFRSKLTPLEYGKCERCGGPVGFKSRTQRDLNDREKYCTTCSKNMEREIRNNCREEWEKIEQKQNTIIKELREMPYQEYLKTEHWQRLRKQTLSHAKYKCEVCDSNGKLNVHHKHYKTRGQETISDLVVLCEECHKKFHGKYDEK